MKVKYYRVFDWVDSFKSFFSTGFKHWNMRASQVLIYVLLKPV